MSLILKLLVAISMSWIFSETAQAQIVERDESGKLHFSADVVGVWDVEDVVRNGISIKENYGPTIFTDDQWIIRTRSGDHTYKLIEVDESESGLLAKFENVRIAKMVITAEMKIEDQKLKIVRRNPTNGLNASSFTFSDIAYTLVRGSEESNAANDMPRLSVRVVNQNDVNKPLLDTTVTPYYGGRLSYSSEGIISSRDSIRLNDYIQLPRDGTNINGKIEAMAEGKFKVLLVMTVGTKVDTSNSDVTVSRSEKIHIETVMPVGKAVSIDCGKNQICELKLE